MRTASGRAGQGGPQGNREAARERATAALEHPQHRLVIHLGVAPTASVLLSAAGAAPAFFRGKINILMTSPSLVGVMPYWSPRMRAVEVETLRAKQK